MPRLTLEPNKVCIRKTLHQRDVPTLKILQLGSFVSPQAMRRTSLKPQYGGKSYNLCSSLRVNYICASICGHGNGNHYGEHMSDTSKHCAL